MHGPLRPLVGPARRLAGRLSAALALAARAAFPLACAGCDAALAPAPGWPLCTACEALAPEAGERFCLPCARGAAAPRACVKPSHLGLRAAWVWSPAVRGVVHAYKFGDAPELAAGLAGRAWATAAFEAAPGRPRPDLIVPVPLHPLRARERGYDQAARLAHAFSALAGAPCADALARTRRTAQQAKLGARARATNVRDAFAVARPELVAGRRIALIDDVVTTGETILAADAVLRAAGAVRVEAWALAYEPLE
jgi:ComF family protein